MEIIKKKFAEGLRLRFPQLRRFPQAFLFGFLFLTSSLTGDDRPARVTNMPPDCFDGLRRLSSAIRTESQTYAQMLSFEDSL